MDDDSHLRTNNFHHTVHVMGIDDGGDIVFSGDFPDQFVDYKGCLWIKA